MQVFVSGVELFVEPETWTFTLDPDRIPVGLNQLNVLVHSDAGSSVQVHPFINQELPSVSWEEDIQPIHEANCAECHGGATETVLSSSSDWEHHIDSIIDVTSMKTMPLGTDPLEEEEITKIRAWKQGGFQ